MSAYSAGAGIHLQTLVLDKSTSSEQKADCLKLLKVILKNLADPIKSQDPKYRQLKLDNPKVFAKLVPCPSSVDYLKDIGFQESNNEEGKTILCIHDGVAIDQILMQASLQEVSNALDIVNPNHGQTQTSPSMDAKVVKKHRTDVVVVVEEKKEENLAEEKLSEKQKARRLVEKAKEMERNEAKARRQKLTHLIAQDKYVRTNDENWTSAPSAACAKSGNSISTFRDRHGENDS